MKKTIVIITTWNDNSNTYECINSLLNEKLLDFDICVVDNNSKIIIYHKLRNFIKKFCKLNKFNFFEYKSFNYSTINRKKNFILINSPINTGCTGGYNLGYNYAINNKYDYVFRLDNDCILSKNAITKNINFLKNNKDYVGVNSKVCYKHLKNRIQWVGVKFGYKLFLHKSIRVFKKPKNINVLNEHVHTKNWKGILLTDSLNGPGSTIKIPYLRKTGLSDPEFFFGPEDIDLSLRLRKLGKLGVNMNSTIYHSVAQSAKVTGMDQRIYFEIKGHLYLLKKISKAYFILGNIYNLIRIISLCILSLVSKNKNNKLKLILKSTKDLLQKKLGINDLYINNMGKEYLINKYLEKIKR